MSWSPQDVLALAAQEAARRTVNSTLGVGTVPFRSVRYRNRFARPLDRGTAHHCGAKFSQSRSKMWQRLLTLPPRRPKDRSPTRTPAGNLRSAADGGAERLDGATHFAAPTSACKGSTFTGTGRARCMEMLRFLKFRRRSMPPWDFRLFVISGNFATTNTREVGLVPTILNHFHLFPSGPLAQSAEGARRGRLLCSIE